MPDGPNRRARVATSRGSSATPVMSRSRANSRPLHACHALRLSPRPLIVGIRRGALDPDVAAFEELALPDRRDLLDALDGVPACGKGVRTVRGSRCYCDAGIADVDSSNPVVQGQPDAGPMAARFLRKSVRMPATPAVRTPRIRGTARAVRRCDCAPGRETSRPPRRIRSHGRDRPPASPAIQATAEPRRWTEAEPSPVSIRTSQESSLRAFQK